MESNYFPGAWRRSFWNIAAATLCLLILFACKEKRSSAVETFDIETGSSVIRQVPDVAKDQVFDAILQQYKGKIVLVDFWATWCGPCRQALKVMTPLKESWEDKNIVFVYLTGETSPLEVWNEMVPNIPGEHYRVSEDQWIYWRQVFGIEGVPTYMIFDKNGKKVQGYTGYPGNDEMQKVIESLF